MRKNFKLLGAVAVAGLVAAGGSAFTATNTGVGPTIAGHQSAAVTGVSVTNVEYVVNTSDASKLSSIVFSETEDVSTGYAATLTLGKGVTATVFTRSDRATITAPVTATGSEADGTITCATTANVADVDSVALTVAQTTTPAA